MAFTAKDVMSLKERTGCGMMACKEALTAADGDVDKAIEILREKGLAQQAKKSGRVAAEGLSYAAYDADKKVGAVVEVNIETDFAAQNENFIKLVHDIADTVIACNPADVEALKACTLAGSDVTVEAAVQELFLALRENMQIRRFARYEGNLVTYVHGGGRIAVLVKFDVDDATATKDEFQLYAKDVAMQIAAMNPSYLSSETVPADVIEKEKEVLMAQIANDPKNASKPPVVIEKMVTGRIGKFYKENCLLQQAFVKDDNIDVATYTENTAKELGASIQVVDYVRFEKGEGIQKKEDNFAEEVASMIK